MQMASSSLSLTFVPYLAYALLATATTVSTERIVREPSAARSTYATSDAAHAAVDSWIDSKYKSSNSSRLCYDSDSCEAACHSSRGRLYGSTSGLTTAAASALTTADDDELCGFATFATHSMR
jgi:hypothetical protein